MLNYGETPLKNRYRVAIPESDNFHTPYVQSV